MPVLISQWAQGMQGGGNNTYLPASDLKNACENQGL